MAIIPSMHDIPLASWPSTPHSLPSCETTKYRSNPQQRLQFLLLQLPGPNNTRRDAHLDCRRAREITRLNLHPFLRPGC